MKLLGGYNFFVVLCQRHFPLGQIRPSHRSDQISELNLIDILRGGKTGLQFENENLQHDHTSLMNH